MFFTGNLFNKLFPIWKSYKIYNMEFPSEEDLQSLKALILPGSYHSVYEPDLPQIEPYKRFIRKVYIEYPNIKLVGVCFGHQIIAEALGG